MFRGHDLVKSTPLTESNAASVCVQEHRKGDLKAVLDHCRCGNPAGRYSLGVIPTYCSHVLCKDGQGMPWTWDNHGGSEPQS